MGDLVYAVRGSSGIFLKRGVRKPEDLVNEKLDVKDVYCRCMAFSNGGQYFAYCDSTRTVLVEATTGRECFSADLGRTMTILFSPRDKYMVTYEQYVIYGTRMNADGTVKTPSPNLRYWAVPSGQLLATVVADKQAMWKPQFTEDETIALRVRGSEICFYKDGNFEKFINKAVVKDINEFSVSPGPNPHVACFIPSKSQPALIQLRLLTDQLDVLFTKTSFNCDRCVMNWNAKGTALLVTASVDVDKSNQSYYGVSHIYCVLTKGGGEAYQVPLNKQGPVHHLEWAPNSSMFCVCYGFMPSKVTIFTTRGDVLWDLGEGHRNEVHFNPQSSILVTCGFGNIASGKMEFWNVAAKNEISQFCVPHTTHFEWAPDGQHICTSTTAPRLRTDNGYRFWTYRGELIHEYACQKEELWEVKWRPSQAYAKFAIEELNKEQKEANQTRKPNSVAPVKQLPKGAITAQGRYVPPHLRGKNNVIGLAPKGGGAAGSTAKTAAPTPTTPKTEEGEAEKRVRTLRKKLDEIVKLKGRLAAGDRLELNQMDKINSERKLKEELAQLQPVEGTC